MEGCGTGQRRAHTILKLYIFLHFARFFNMFTDFPQNNSWILKSGVFKGQISDNLVQLDWI